MLWCPNLHMVLEVRTHQHNRVGQLNGLEQGSVLLLVLTMHSTWHHAVTWGAWTPRCCAHWVQQYIELWLHCVLLPFHICVPQICTSAFYSVNPITNLISEQLYIKCVTPSSTMNPRSPCLSVFRNFFSSAWSLAGIDLREAFQDISECLVMLARVCCLWACLSSNAQFLYIQTDVGGLWVWW